MFKKFGNILGKKNDNKKEESELSKKISKMNLNDMRAYVNGKMSDFEVDEDGIIEILKRIIKKVDEKRYLNIDDDDTKKKKAFDLILTIAKHQKLTVVAVELIQEFTEIYKDIIKKFDQDNKQIYESKLKNAIIKAIEHINNVTDLKQKMDLLGR